MPLTQDHNALQMLVEEVSTQDFQIQGSALGEAIDEGIKLLTNDETSTAGKALLVLSDGEVHNIQTAFEAGHGQRSIANSDLRFWVSDLNLRPSPWKWRVCSR